MIDVPANRLSSDIDFKYSLANAYVAEVNGYGITALGRTVAISLKDKEATTARLLDIQKDMESHYMDKGLIKTRIVDTSKSVALDF